LLLGAFFSLSLYLFVLFGGIASSKVG